MRYELGVDAGYTFAYSEDQALTPYFKLAYVYDDANNDADVNGDPIDNGTEGSAVRVGLGTQFSFTKNFSAYTDANYLGGGDVDQTGLLTSALNTLVIVPVWNRCKRI